MTFRALVEELLDYTPVYRADDARIVFPDHRDWNIPPDVFNRLCPHMQNTACEAVSIGCPRTRDARLLRNALLERI